MDLSILLPARNELFLRRTIEDILAHSEAKTEIIAVLDGAWADPPIEDHPMVSLVYLPESIGQRAATNLACRLSRAKYVMKVDAHCSFGQGFDRILVEDMQEDWTVVVPLMKNLHAFNWICEEGHTRYQGRSGVCEECGKETERQMIWLPRKRTETWSWGFDKDLRFQYNMGPSSGRPPKGDTPVETMSLLGACWMMDREKYWDIGICDEAHGSWGQMGTEIGAKAWLSGGKLMCNRRTWFAHMFRTQGGDFGFPYKQSGKQVEKARKYSRNLWHKNKWPKAVHELDWLVKKFNPKGW